jgi:hypothetical protein
MGRIVHPLEINPKLVLHVGMVAIQWARVEFTLSRMTVGLLKSDAPIGLLLTSDLGFQTIQHFIACYVQTNHPHGPDFGEEITALIGEADRLRIIRNSLVHNSWHPDEEDEHRLLVLRFRGKIRMYSEVWPDPVLVQVVEHLIELLRGLSDFIQSTIFWKASTSGSGAHHRPIHLLHDSLRMFLLVIPRRQTFCPGFDRLRGHNQLNNGRASLRRRCTGNRFITTASRMWFQVYNPRMALPNLGLSSGQITHALVQPSPQNIPLLFSRESVVQCVVPPGKRGGSRSSRTRGGMRWTQGLRLTSVARAYGEVVWS